ncbi:UBX domain-containing protein 7-like, partial [Trifolium medium]|nr:UBX domain-containing protein 7-like [Trifolium medium]
GATLGHLSQEPNSLIAFRNFEQETRRPGVWESEQGAASTAESSQDTLASLYRPPFHLMFTGSFDKHFVCYLVLGKRHHFPLTFPYVVENKPWQMSVATNKQTAIQRRWRIGFRIVAAMKVAAMAGKPSKKKGNVSPSTNGF